MIIRRALNKDIPQILELLSSVLELHAKIRPDVFISGTTKFSNEELQVMVKDDHNPIYVGVDGDRVLGYIFCEIKEPNGAINMKQVRSLYIEDLCVNENGRGQHVGTTLFNFVKEEAKKLKCYDIKLNVWAGNDAAIKFYEKMGLKVRSSIMEIKI
ncbi:MAG: GNAT family N-acetyltransferase [Bacilli bacterium]|nr:GNAT family N-acetyltransferase [Bacilli bacterium]